MGKDIDQQHWIHFGTHHLVQCFLYGDTFYSGTIPTGVMNGLPQQHQDWLRRHSGNRILRGDLVEWINL